MNIETIGKELARRVKTQKDLHNITSQLMKSVLETALNAEMVERSIIQSFNHRVLRAVKAITPKLRTAIITIPLPFSAFDFILMAEWLDVEYIFPHYYWISQRHVEELEKIGVKLVPWTVNTPEQWESMIDLGVDGVITDDPQALIEYLQKKGLR